MDAYKRHRLGGLSYADNYYRTQQIKNYETYAKGISDENNRKFQEYAGDVNTFNANHLNALNKLGAEQKTDSSLVSLGTTGLMAGGPKAGKYLMNKIKDRISKGKTGVDDTPTAELAGDEPAYVESGGYADPESAGYARPTPSYAEAPYAGSGPSEPPETYRGGDPPMPEGLRGQPYPPELGTGRLGRVEGGMNDYEIGNFHDPEFNHWTDVGPINRRITSMPTRDDPLNPLPEGVGYPSESTTSSFGVVGRYDEVPGFLARPKEGDLGPAYNPESTASSDYGPAPDPPPRIQSLRRRSQRSLPEDDSDILNDPDLANIGFPQDRSVASSEYSIPSDQPPQTSFPSEAELRQEVAEGGEQFGFGEKPGFFSRLLGGKEGPQESDITRFTSTEDPFQAPSEAPPYSTSSGSAGYEEESKFNPADLVDEQTAGARFNLAKDTGPLDISDPRVRRPTSIGDELGGESSSYVEPPSVGEGYAQAPSLSGGGYAEAPKAPLKEDLGDIAEAGLPEEAEIADEVAGATVAIPGLDIITAAAGAILTAGALGSTLFHATEGSKLNSQVPPPAPEPTKTKNISQVGGSYSLAGKYVGASADNYQQTQQHFNGF